MNPLYTSCCEFRLLLRVSTNALLAEAKHQRWAPDHMCSRIMDELRHRERLERLALDERWKDSAGRSTADLVAAEPAPW